MNASSAMNLPGRGVTPPGRQHIDQARAQRVVHLFIAEQQEILRGAYEAALSAQEGIDVVGVSGVTSGEAVARAVALLHPDVALIGVRTLDSIAVRTLEMVRVARPLTALSLLSASYEQEGLRALREFARGGPSGFAYLLKHTLDTAAQLAQVVRTAAEGRVVLDPAVMDGLMATASPQARQLRKLSKREMEVLGLMAKGFRNSVIAKTLGLELKTVDRHINGIYSKLGAGPGTMHPRVHAVTLYLQAAAQDLGVDAERQR